MEATGAVVSATEKPTQGAYLGHNFPSGASSFLGCESPLSEPTGGPRSRGPTLTLWAWTFPGLWSRHRQAGLCPQTLWGAKRDASPHSRAPPLSLASQDVGLSV